MKRLLLACVAMVVLMPAADAVAAPHVVVWSGLLQPHAAAGVELRSDGSLRALSADAAGRVHLGGVFAPRVAKVAAIRAAAEQLLAHGPNGTHAPTADGPYLTVALEDGSRQRFVTDTGASSASVVALVERLNAGLPRKARIVTVGTSGTARAAALGTTGQAAAVSTLPTALPTGVCPSILRPPTVIEKTVPLQQAVRDGLVTGLSPKGALGGDAVGVDATWKNLDAPTSVKITAQVSTDVQGKADLPTLTGRIQTFLNDAYSGYSVNGQPVTFDFQLTPRATGEPAAPCTHQILITDTGKVGASWVTGSSNAGQFSAVLDDALNPDSVAHEMGHVLDIDDHYQALLHFKDGRADVPLPTRPLDDTQLQPLLDLHHVTADAVTVISKPKAADETGSYKHDLMAGNGRRLRPSDMATITARADVVLTADPGDVLVNKDHEDQNVVVGAAFALPVPRGRSVHTDGIVAYCIDTARETPRTSGQAGFDVLGRAGDMGTPAMSALQRVVDVVAARQPGPLEATPGATNAIWRVSDDFPVSASDTSANGILAAAGVSPTAATGITYAAPHFTDPAAGIARPVALSSPSGVPVPAEPAPAAVPGVLAHGSKLVRLHLAARRVHAPHGRGVAAIVASIALAGAPDRVTLSLTQRHGHRTVTVARTRARQIPSGQTALVLYGRRLKPGSYWLLARGAHSGKLTARVTVTRARKR